MKALKYICLVVAILAVIFAAGYLGVWVMLIGGIVQLIEAVRADPVHSLGVAVGIARILGAGFVGVLTFWVGALIVGAIAIFSSD